jgi:hypothetical protein
MATHLKGFRVVQPLETYGAVMSLALIAIASFLSGQVEKAEAARDGLSILRCAGYSLKSFQSGQPLLIEY